MIPGETIGSGGSYDGACDVCRTPMPMQVLHSGGGFYIGTFCHNQLCEDFGPNSRESGYYNTREEAQQALVDGLFGR